MIKEGFYIKTWSYLYGIVKRPLGVEFVLEEGMGPTQIPIEITSLYNLVDPDWFPNVKVLTFRLEPKS